MLFHVNSVWPKNSWNSTLCIPNQATKVCDTFLQSWQHCKSWKISYFYQSSSSLVWKFFLDLSKPLKSSKRWLSILMGKLCTWFRAKKVVFKYLGHSKMQEKLAAISKKICHAQLKKRPKGKVIKPNDFSIFFMILFNSVVKNQCT